MNPPAAGFATITCLRVILAVASSTIREGERLHFTLKFLRHRCRDTPRSGIMIQRRPGIVAKQSRSATNNCAYLKTGPTRVRSATFSLDDRSPAEGRNGWPMPRLPPDRDFSASQSEDDIHAEIAELFASRTPGILSL